MFEIELKALFNVENKKKIIKKIKEIYPDYTKMIESKQLNHYFVTNKKGLLSMFDNFPNTFKGLKDKINGVNEETISIRSRYDDKKGTYFILKWGEDGVNGKERREEEVEISSEIKKLDNLLKRFGIKPESKWSRDRTLFIYDHGISICVDINSGYGGIVEVEKIIWSDNLEEDQKILALNIIKDILTSLNLVELDKELLNKMYNYYINNWEDFYKKDRYIWQEENFVKGLN